VRELQNTVERAVILSEPGMPLSPVVLGLGEGTGFPVSVRLASRQGKGTGRASVAETRAGAQINGGTGARSDVDLPLAEIEKKHILRVLESCADNRTRAAEALGISIRTLRNKLQEYRGE
jgi:two-component system response regulator HydG/two-component system response regulator AtoC/two-component system response regulator FlrC